MRLCCYFCGKSVSNDVPRDTVVRALLICPECIENGRLLLPEGPGKADPVLEAFLDYQRKEHGGWGQRLAGKDSDSNDLGEARFPQVPLDLDATR